MRTTSFIAHRSPDGTRLNAVLSLGALKHITYAQREALRGLNINNLSDLLHFEPIHRARIVLAIARGEIAHDLDLRQFIKNSAALEAPATLATAPCELIDGIGESYARILANSFSVRTIAQLAEFAPYLEAEVLLRHQEDAFSEPASAPDELLPRTIGSVSSEFRFSTFIVDRELRLTTSMRYTIDETNVVVRALAPGVGPWTLSLGYIALHKQRWVNMGTQLGEVVKTIALAPGESRNIAVLDWQWSHVFTRKESTDAAEQLSNAVVHNRALDEVARGVAQEHQWGRTTALAATGVAGVGAVASSAAVAAAAGGAAGTATGISVGGLAGAIIGGVLSSETGGWGAIPGLLGGSIAGGAAFGMAGAAAGALIGGTAGGIGFLFSDSRGDRSIVSDDRQNIMDMTVQKSSFSRSLRSTIMLDDFQQEKTNAKTFNVTNYNHSHALNLTYFEILHRYHVSLQTERIEPFVILPMKGIDFTDRLIAHYWDVLRYAFPDARLREKFDQLITPQGYLDLPGSSNSSEKSPDEPMVTRLEFEMEVHGIFAHYPSENDKSGFGDVSTVWVEADDGTCGFMKYEKSDDNLSPRFDHLRSRHDTYLKLSQIRRIKVQLPHCEGLRPVAEYKLRMKQMDILLPDSSVVTISDWDVGSAGENAWYLGSHKLGVDDNGLKDLMYDFKPVDRVPQIMQTALDGRETRDKVVRYIKRRKYYFTRYLLSQIEVEQLVDLVGVLKIELQEGLSFGLIDIIDPVPIGVTSRGLMFRLKKASEHVGGDTGALTSLEDFLHDIESMARDQKNQVESREIFLPTNGVFCEALLGRANGSEKIDLSRFWNWQDSPIPHQAPVIAPLALDNRAQPMPNVQPTLPGNVLNIVQPGPLPDPSGMQGVLSALQSGTMFRDMSKTEQLTGLMGNLANLAGSAATSAGGMAGSAAEKTLQAALQLGQRIADISEKLLSSVPGTDQAQRPPQNITHEGGRENARTRSDESLPTDAAPVASKPRSPSANSLPGRSPDYDRTLPEQIRDGRSRAVADVFGGRGLPEGDALRAGRYDGGVLLRDFAVRGDALTDQHRGALAQFAMLITSSEQARVYIEGHASRTGPEEENIRLSEYRAAVAWDWLREEGGVPQERFLSDEDGPNIVGVGSAYPPGSAKEGVEDGANRSVMLYYSIPKVECAPTLVAAEPPTESARWNVCVALGLTSGITPQFGGIGATAALILLSDAARPAGERPVRHPYVFANAAFARVLLEEEEDTGIGATIRKWWNSRKIIQRTIWQMIWEGFYAHLGGTEQDVPLLPVPDRPDATGPLPLARFNGTACELVVRRDGSFIDLGKVTLTLPALGLTASLGFKTIGATGVHSIASSGSLYAVPNWVRLLIPDHVREWANLSADGP